MGLLADWQIRGLCVDQHGNPLERPMIEPFHECLSRPGIISFGVSSYGYDVRVGRHFKVFTNVYGTVIDPKRFSREAFVDIESDHCIIPPNSFALAETVEYFEIPRDVLAVCVGKSTYARCGIVVNVTPLEPCMSSDTEVLTRQGWRMLSDVFIGQEVLTRRDDGLAEYRSIENKQERYFSGDLLHFNGRSVNQLVTPDHRLPVWKRIGGNSEPCHKWEIRSADSIFGKHNYSLDRYVRWESQEPKTIHVAGRDYDACDFLYFFGCWLGDGSAFRGNDGGYHIKLAVVTKERKRTAFASALEKLGIRAAIQARGFHFYNKDLCLWLKQFGHAKDKFIPRWVLGLGPKSLTHLLHGLLDSDGTVSTSTYTTASKQLADDVQELMYKCGFAAIVREVYSDRFGKESRAYKIRLSNKHMAPKIRPGCHEKIPYHGMVYDITVPNHVFFCRRNGKASWTGNCWRGKITIEISNTTPLPAKIYANEGISQILFFRADAVCEKSYADKKGKYQDQKGLTLPFVVGVQNDGIRCRRHHGQSVRHGYDAARRQHAAPIAHPSRGPHCVGPSHTEPDVRICQQRRQPWHQGYHRWCWRSGTLAGHDRSQDDVAGARRADRVRHIARHGFAAVDCADARWCSRRHARHWSGRSRQRGIACSGNPGAQRS